MKRAALAVLVAAAALSLYIWPMPVVAQPELTEVVPEDGAVLAGPPSVVRLCFLEPVLHDEPDDFRFAMLTPEGTRLGLRIVFQPLTNCVDIHPGLPDSPPFGQWALEWEVTGEADGEVASGTVQYQVAEGGSPVPSPSPVVPVSPRSGGTSTPGDAAPPSPADGGDDGLGAGWIAIIVAGSSLGALGVVAALFLLRRRAGPGQSPPPSA